MNRETSIAILGFPGGGSSMTVIIVTVIIMMLVEESVSRSTCLFVGECE